MNDIYTRLQNGETAEEIVASFTAELNEAEDRIKRDEAERLQKLEQDTRRIVAKNELKEILSDFVDWMAEYMDMDDLEITNAELDALTDAIMLAMQLETIKFKWSIKPEPKVTTANNDPFEDFFKKFGF